MKEISTRTETQAKSDQKRGVTQKAFRFNFADIEYIDSVAKKYKLTLKDLLMKSVRLYESTVPVSDEKRTYSVRKEKTKKFKITHEDIEFITATAKKYDLYENEMVFQAIVHFDKSNS